MRNSLVSLVLLAGCAGAGVGSAGPRVPAESPRGIAWKEIRLPDARGESGVVLGYCYAEALPGKEGLVVRVFDRDRRPLGFVTPRGRALRFAGSGEGLETIDVGTGEIEVAIARILDAPRPVVLADWVPPPVEIPPPAIR